MRSFFSQLILPLPFLLILNTVAFIAYKKGKHKSAKSLIIAAIFLLAAISTPFIPNLLVKNLENKYGVITIEGVIDSKRPVHILVLGSGHTNDIRLPANSQLTTTTLVRLVEGIRIQRQIPRSVLITSADKGNEDISQAEVVAKAAILLGINESDIKMQTKPKNTWMEATEYKRLFGDTAQLVVVTSAIHMPRAMFLFKKAGLQPVAAPTDYLLKKGKKNDSWFWVPSSRNISKMESAIHEYLGFLWVKLGGK